MNLAKGLCNCLRSLQVSSIVLLCKIIEVRYCSQDILIPRITHHCIHSHLPFTLCRRQFPVTGAFAITINKLQGQSHDWVGIYLRNEAMVNYMWHCLVVDILQISMLPMTILMLPMTTMKLRELWRTLFIMRFLYDIVI